MAQTQRLFRRFPVAAAVMVVAVIAVTTSMAQSSRRQVVAWIRQRSGQLALFRVETDQQVQCHPAAGGMDLPAWRDQLQSDRRARRDLRPRPERLDRRRRREDRKRAVGPREHERHEQPRHDVLGEPRRPRSAADLPDEQPAPGARREDREVDHVVRHKRRRRLENRHRRPRPRDDRKHPVANPRRGVREPDHSRQRAG